jgi:REP element-mobilizing transposase RayT
MARRPRVFAAGLLYHVIVRGNQRRKTFGHDDDYRAYLDRLEKYRTQCQVRIYAYCLMPNHVHLLVETGSPPLAKFMQGVQQSYTQYFNRRYRKVGHLFQGRYRAIICDRDKYLLALVRYIHLNAVRAKLASRPERYRYSGHNSYLTDGTAKIVETTPVLKLMGGKKGYERFVLAAEFGVRHNNQYRLDTGPGFLLRVESWPVVPECSRPVCSITSLSGATNGARRFETMTITERTSTDSRSTAPSAECASTPTA